VQSQDLDPNAGFGRFWFRVTACHLVTYFIAGLIAYSLFDYKGLFQAETLSCYMRPISSKWVAAGPSLQVIRGLIIALALYPFRQIVLETAHGWLKLAGVLVGLSVLSPAGATPGSVEGFIYTQVTWVQHLQGLPEVILQNVAFAWLLTAWYRSPRRSWTVVLGILTLLAIAMSLAGALLNRGS
jgi:hypothetical protein